MSDENIQADLREFLQDTKGEDSGSIRQKFGVDKYGLDVHAFYQDIKVATIGLLVQHAIGSDEYVKINNYFRFVVEMIFREGHRFGLVPLHDPESDSAENAFESEAMEGFYKIYVDVKEWYNEGYYIKSQNGVLFSSWTGKACVDPRETETHGSFDTTKLAPADNNKKESQIGTVSPAMTRIPHPAVPPTELLSFFKHPIDASLSSSKWLKFDEYSSFAPSKDNAGSILDPLTTGSVWFEKLGQKKLVTEEDVNEAAKERIKELEEQLSNDKDVEMTDADGERDKENENGSTTEEAKKEDEEDQKEEKEEKEKRKEENSGSSIEASATPEQEGGEDPADIEAEDIDIESVLEWTPASFVDDDEVEAAEAGTEQELVSNLLLQLQHMQRVRLSNNAGTTEFSVPAKERRLAIKIQNILTRLVQDETPKSLDMAVSSNVPVLQTNYQGVLPTPPEARQMPQAGRLAGLNSRATPSRAKARR